MEDLKRMQATCISCMPDVKRPWLMRLDVKADIDGIEGKRIWLSNYKKIWDECGYGSDLKPGDQLEIVYSEKAGWKCPLRNWESVENLSSASRQQQRGKREAEERAARVKKFDAIFDPPGKTVSPKKI